MEGGIKMKKQEEKQLMHLEFLIKEFYSNSKVYQVDEVEERIYFYIEGEEDVDRQAVIDRELEEIIFKYKGGEDWYDLDYASFAKVNEVNGVPIF